MPTLDKIVQVKYESQDITRYVISYERSQKMCTSVDTLHLVLAPGSGGNFHPWDKIRIYESGKLKGTYYVNDGGVQQPDGSYFLAAQDNSKRLVDYFITDTYFIDYPTYSRDWIEKFLKEVKAPYTFTTDSYGSLLSNNTTMRLMRAYEQILYLLQISGWYLYFNKTGTAIIGEISPDLGHPKGSVGKRRLTSAKIISHDKMLRNRVVVWGSLDPVTSGTIFSDMSTITPWNYDKNDLRTIAIVNSNIPDQASADSIAAEALNSFARITVEKHLEIPEEKGWKIGDPIKAFGKVGVVTTQGAHFSASTGYRADIILGERCPRLWAFFDMGDYVYIGTETSGIHRKHIKFDNVWNPYYSGLPEMGISDLFVRENLASTVTLSGNAYYTPCSEDYPSWNGITIPPLETSSTSGIPYTIESGIKARAVTHDKTSNNIRLLVDTYSGDNPPGYFELLSGYNFPKAVSGCRTWVLDYSTNDSSMLGEETSSGITLISSYPIHLPEYFGTGYSGAYSSWDCRGVDIENDGKNDYISVISPYMSPDNSTLTRMWYYGCCIWPHRKPQGIGGINIKLDYPKLTVSTLEEFSKDDYYLYWAWFLFVRTYTALPCPIRVNGEIVYYTKEVTTTRLTRWRDGRGARPDFPFAPTQFSEDLGSGVYGWHSAGNWRRNLHPWWYFDWGGFDKWGGVQAIEYPPKEEGLWPFVTLTWFLPMYCPAPSGENGENTCHVLRRDGENLTVIENGMYPFRLDVSSVSPLVTVQDSVGTFDTFYNAISGFTQTSPTAGNGTMVNDYRYSSFTTQSGTTSSGNYKDIIYTTPSGIFLMPIDNLTESDDISVLTNGVPVALSGSPSMVETTNFSFPNQYVFVSTSGDLYRFYEKSPSGVMTVSGMDYGFIEYPSGLPNSRITTIRVEDLI